MSLRGKYLLLICTLLFMIAFSSSVLAYLTASDYENNEFTVGACNTEIIEKYDAPDRLEPGISFTKDVRVKNIGPSDCFVRIKAVFTNQDMGKFCIVDWNLKDYELNSSDGYYYYKERLAEGDMTESLFTTVKISDSVDKDEMQEFDILIYSEALRCTDGEVYKQVWGIGK